MIRCSDALLILSLSAASGAAACGEAGLDAQGLQPPDPAGAAHDAGAADDSGAGQIGNRGGSRRAADAGATSTLRRGNATCIATGNCFANACAPHWSPGCSEACLAPEVVGPDVRPLAKEVVDCVLTQCAWGECVDSKEKDCVHLCALDRCLGRLVACVDQGNSSKGASGSKGCDTFTTCMDKSNFTQSAPFTSMAACYNNLSKHGKDLAQTLASCVDDTGMISNCCINTVRCATNGKTGDEPCGYYLNNCVECVDESRTEGAGCFPACMAKVNAAGQQIFADQNHLNCHDMHEYDHTGTGAVPVPACLDLYHQCVLHEVDGELSCSGALTCLADCTQQAAASGEMPGMARNRCRRQCEGELRLASQPAWVAHDKCLVYCEADCGGAGDACAEKCPAGTCAATATACLNDK